jgi:radical SAM protein with 4Fe4S-binding SPASM domain
MPKMDFSDISKLAELENRRTVTLTVTRKCNLRCKYCYESDEQRNVKAMSFKTAKDAITRYMEADDGFDAVEFQFFGGEPMLEFPLIKEVVEWFKSRTWIKKFIFFIVSNGTILTDEMKTWLKDNKKMVVLGFSIDGNRTSHNISRDNSYDLLLSNLPFFTENWPHQPAKMTICKENIPYIADSIIELEEMGINFTANIVFEDIWGDSEEKDELLAIYQDQLDQLVEYYSQNPQLNPVGPIFNRGLEHYNQPIRNTVTLDSDCSRFCGAGHEMAMIDVDGTEFPCHRFAPWITKRPSPIQPVNRQEEWGPEKCKECKLLSVCSTCAGFNWETNGDTAIRTTYHCEAVKVELLATAKLHAVRLGNMGKSELNKLSGEELSHEKVRLDAILSMVNEGI